MKTQSSLWAVSVDDSARAMISKLALAYLFAMTGANPLAPQTLFLQSHKQVCILLYFWPTTFSYSTFCHTKHTDGKAKEKKWYFGKQPSSPTLALSIDDMS